MDVKYSFALISPGVQFAGQQWIQKHGLCVGIVVEPEQLKNCSRHNAIRKRNRFIRILHGDPIQPGAFFEDKTVW